MKRKLLFSALCAVIVLQLAAVAGFIVYYESLDSKIETQGTEYRFRVVLDSVLPDGSILFSTEQDLNSFYYYYYHNGQNAKVVMLKAGEDGFTEFGDMSDSVPNEGAYILLDRPNMFPNENEYASGNTNLYDPLHDSFGIYYEPYWDQETTTRQPEAYVTVRVYRGHAAITGMYIAGEDVRTLDALPEPVPAEDTAENI